eukprot:TRINITY_DN12584_c0_g4_i1.p1 TRINITY_DN12584_c0_g4~~TRINITY_DN12584_c0_g4_i1.p1  ORF type:complete len:785 (+),score=180.64 TRINITY_DN12584_c0_g4_i1:38-2356(+)
MSYGCFDGIFAQEDQDINELLKKQLRAPGGKGKAVKEGWVDLVTSRAPQKRHVYARLTADSLVCYQDRPKLLQEQHQESQASTSSGSTKAQMLEGLLLSKVASVLGRGEGSEFVRITFGKGSWWQLYFERKEEIAEWAEVLVQRHDKFKTARRRSSMYQEGDQEALKQRLEDRKWARWRHTLRRFLPCVPASYDFSRAVGGGSPYRGSRERYEGGELVDAEALAGVTDPDLMEAQGGHWSETAVSYLRKIEQVPEDLIADFHASVRKGVPDGLKRLIWPLAAGRAVESKASTVDSGSFYKSLLDRSFGEVHPEQFQDPVPTFCQGVHGVEDAPPLAAAVKHLKLLQPQGQDALRRLLWVTQLTCHSVEFCPFLPNLMAALLVFFSEAETMFIVSVLLSEEENSIGNLACPRIILNLSQMQKQAKLLVREGRKPRVIPHILEHLEGIGVRLEELATRLLQDGLASRVPFRAFTRLLGAFLGQGSEVILRYALALLKSREEALLACKTSEEVLKVLEAPGTGENGSQEAPVSLQEVDVLTKIAFSLPLKNLAFGRVTSIWNISYAGPDYGSKHIFCRPRLFEPRGNVPDELWEKLWSYVPANCRIFDPMLVYLPVKHGTSLRTCLENCKQHKDAPMIFFLYSKAGDIIGGFSPVIWVRTHGYIDPMSTTRGCEDAFVFRRLHGSKSDVDVFLWSGENQMLLDASEISGLIFGGDSASIHVHKELQRATSCASHSFGAPPLLQEDVKRSKSNDSASSQAVGDTFELLRFEVFALK